MPQIIPPSRQVSIPGMPIVPCLFLDVCDEGQPCDGHLINIGSRRFILLVLYRVLLLSAQIAETTRESVLITA